MHIADTVFINIWEVLAGLSYSEGAALRASEPPMRRWESPVSPFLEAMPSAIRQSSVFIRCQRYRCRAQISVCWIPICRYWQLPDRFIPVSWRIVYATWAVWLGNFMPHGFAADGCCFGYEYAHRPNTVLPEDNIARSISVQTWRHHTTTNHANVWIAIHKERGKHGIWNRNERWATLCRSMKEMSWNQFPRCFNQYTRETNEPFSTICLWIRKQSGSTGACVSTDEVPSVSGWPSVCPCRKCTIDQSGMCYTISPALCKRFAIPSYAPLISMRSGSQPK